MPLKSDGTAVSNREAIAAWLPLARGILLETARSYHATITYKQLAEQVQQVSGISTRQQIQHWIGGLLEQVALESAELGGPPLTSLCVHQDGSIGDGYKGAPRFVAVDDALDDEEQAAHDRLLCYRELAADLPADGGVAALTPQVVERRLRQTETRRPRLQEMTCPHCFLVVAVGRTCSNCGEPLP